MDTLERVQTVMLEAGLLALSASRASQKCASYHFIESLGAIFDKIRREWVTNEILSV